MYPRPFIVSFKRLVGTQIPEVVVIIYYYYVLLAISWSMSVLTRSAVVTQVWLGVERNPSAPSTFNGSLGACL